MARLPHQVVVAALVAPLLYELVHADVPEVDLAVSGRRGQEVALLGAVRQRDKLSPCGVHTRRVAPFDNGNVRVAVAALAAAADAAVVGGRRRAGAHRRDALVLAGQIP
eukprot:115335-Chlamydomonas_euryale.AAC.1